MKRGTKISTSNRLLRLNTSQYRREYKSGAVYHGELVGSKKSGKGIFKWPNGACYDGEYVDNTRHGYGKQYWPDSSIYDGAFVRDLRHGVGTLTWADGEVSLKAALSFTKCQRWTVFDFVNEHQFCPQ